MYTDSVGNVYASLPKRPPIHKAKATRSGPCSKKGRKCRKPTAARRRKRLGLAHVHEGDSQCKPRVSRTDT